MNSLQLNELLALIDNAELVGDPNISFNRIISNSRECEPRDLFIAIQGEHFDGHDYLKEVAEKGAAAALVVTNHKNISTSLALPLIKVKDTRQALGQLATRWRQKFSLPVVAVIGSNGKTTVKEMIHSIFKAEVGERNSVASFGNFNNDLGVPFSLLKLCSQHRLAVFEVGMNHIGETAALIKMVAPTILLINNAQREHQEFMESVEKVAQEHASAIYLLKDDAKIVIPADDHFTPLWHEAAGQRSVIKFNLKPAAVSIDDLSIERQTLSDSKQVNAFFQPCPQKQHQMIKVNLDNEWVKFVLPMVGQHSAKNAVAAIACARFAQVSTKAIIEGLSYFQPVVGRLKQLVVQYDEIKGAQLIDDSYNANPDSVRAAIDILKACPGRKVLVFGDMGEMGIQAYSAHREIGEYAYSQGIDALLTFGRESLVTWQTFNALSLKSSDDVHSHDQHSTTKTLIEKGGHFLDQNDLIRSLNQMFIKYKWNEQTNTILVKGSKSMSMKNIVSKLAAPVLNQCEK